MVLKELILNSFLLWDGVVVGCGDVVVLKELILNIFYFQRCGGPERTDLNSFYFQKVWWS